MALLNIIPAAQKFNPISLSGDTVTLLNNTKETADFFPAILVSLSATAVLIVLSILVFNKKKI